MATTPTQRYRALISAHRCGRGARPELDNRAAGVREAARVGAHYVEFDIQRCRDGVFVCHHDEHVTTRYGARRRIADLTWDQLHHHVPGIERLETLLAAVAETDLAAHLDLKFLSPTHLFATPADTWEVACAEQCRAALGDRTMILTTNEDPSVKALRHWVRSSGHDYLVGLSLGRHPRGLGLRKQVSTRLSELFPGRRMAECDATLLVTHHVLAQLRLLRWAARNNLPVLVFTVDGRRATRRLMHDPRVWLMTTNWPARALALTP